MKSYFNLRDEKNHPIHQNDHVYPPCKSQQWIKNNFDSIMVTILQHNSHTNESRMALYRGSKVQWMVEIKRQNQGPRLHLTNLIRVSIIQPITWGHQLCEPMRKLQKIVNQWERRTLGMIWLHACEIATSSTLSYKFVQSLRGGEALDIWACP